MLSPATARGAGKKKKQKNSDFCECLGIMKMGKIICQIVSVSRYLKHHLHSGNQTWLAGKSISDICCLLISH